MVYGPSRKSRLGSLGIEPTVDPIPDDSLRVSEEEGGLFKGGGGRGRRGGRERKEACLRQSAVSNQGERGGKLYVTRAKGVRNGDVGRRCNTGVLAPTNTATVVTSDHAEASQSKMRIALSTSLRHTGQLHAYTPTRDKQTQTQTQARMIA